MAKKETPSGGLINSWDKLNDMLNDSFPDGEIMDINPIAKIDEWIGTGFYILNAAFSGSIFGGVPNRRSVAFAGDEGCLQKNEEVEIYILRNPKLSQLHEIKRFNTSEKN